MNRLIAAGMVLGLLLIPAGAASAALVTHWQFEEASGTTTAFDSVGINHGTLMGTLGAGDFVPGTGWDGGGALWLDGSDAYVEVPDDPSLEFPADQAFSISLWYKRDGVENDQGLVTKGYGDDPRSDLGYYLLQTRNDGFTFDSRRDAGGTPRTRIDNTGASHGDNEWHHFVAVRDSVSNEIRTYVDQTFVVVYDMGADPLNNGDWAMGVNDEALSIGDHLDRYTEGYFDDIRVYDHALNQDEVLGLAGIPVITWADPAVSGDWEDGTKWTGGVAPTSGTVAKVVGETGSIPGSSP